MRSLALTLCRAMLCLLLAGCAADQGPIRAYGTSVIGSAQTLGRTTVIQRAVIPGFERHFAPQESDQWCWAACAQMVIAQQLGQRVSQADLAAGAFGTRLNRPATAETLNHSMALTVGSGRSMRTMRAVYLDGLPTQGMLWEDLQAGRPRILAVATPESRGREHVVVCYGAEAIQSGSTGVPSGKVGGVGGSGIAGNGLRIQRLYIFDPAPGRGAMVVGYDAIRTPPGSDRASAGSGQPGASRATPQVTGSFRIVVVGG